MSKRAVKITLQTRDYYSPHFFNRNIYLIFTFFLLGSVQNAVSSKTPSLKNAQFLSKAAARNNHLFCSIAATFFTLAWEEWERESKFYRKPNLQIFKL